MSNLDPIWLALAGLGGGLSGSIAGLASLVTYPALLAVGLPPVAANVTNTVGLVFNSAGSVLGSRPELKGQGTRAKHLLVSAVTGGIVGGALLLATPSSSFARVVPVLIGLASLAVLMRRNPGRPVASGAHPPGWALSGGVFAIGIYGGYFGAAAGVVMLALLLISTGESLPRANAMRNILLGAANGIAAVAFAIFGPVHWVDVLPLAVGCLVGGRIGPVVVRHAPTGPLRILIACAGLGLSVHLGLDAYR